MTDKAEPASMTGKQYGAAMKQFGLSHAGVGRFLDVGDRTSRRWKSGEIDVPEAVAKLFRMMIRFGLKPEDVK